MPRIPLSNRPGLFVTVDPEAFERLSEFRWRLTSEGYAARTPRVGEARPESVVYMHREILGLVPGDGKEADHGNGDTLDNRGENLRAGTHAENGRGFRTKSPGKSSRYRGVTWFKPTSRWTARAVLDRKTYYFGYFHSEDDAAEAVNAFWVEHGYAAPNVIAAVAA